MTMLAPSAEAQFVPSAHEGGLLRRMFRSFGRAVQISRCRAALQEIPDYMLRDIGISRSDIDAVSVSIVDGTPDPTRLPRGRA